MVDEDASLEDYLFSQIPFAAMITLLMDVCSSPRYCSVMEIGYVLSEEEQEKYDVMNQGMEAGQSIFPPAEAYRALVVLKDLFDHEEKKEQFLEKLENAYPGLDLFNRYYQNNVLHWLKVRGSEEAGYEQIEENWVTILAAVLHNQPNLAAMHPFMMDLTSSALMDLLSGEIDEVYD